MSDPIELAVRHLPDSVEGPACKVWISRGPTIATARVGPTFGRYAADLWKIEGNPLPWRVRADGRDVRRFEDEAAAVEYFMGVVQKTADGGCDD